jgi:hypothetical protein
MTKGLTTGFAALLAALALAPAAAATTTTLDATADSRVESAYPNYNYGRYNLKAQLGAIRSYLKFDLSSLPAETITQATLRVAPISSSSPGLESFAVDDSDWTEDEITWNNQPGPNGGSVGQTGAWSDGPAWVSMDVTSIVAGRTGAVSMMVEAADAGVRTVLKSRHWGETGPKLDVVTASRSPALSVAPSSFSFTGVAGGDDPVPESLRVSNAGGGTLSYTVSDDADWLSESPTSGTGPGGISVTVSTAGLAAGTYAATIMVDGGDAEGSPATIPVTLTVTAVGCNRVASLAAAGSEIAAGRDACLADGTYSGPLTLSTSATSRVTLSAEHEGRAQISGLVALNSHTAIDGLDLTNSSDCVRIPTAQTDIAVLQRVEQRARQRQRDPKRRMELDDGSWRRRDGDGQRADGVSQRRGHPLGRRARLPRELHPRLLEQRGQPQRRLPDVGRRRRRLPGHPADERLDRGQPHRRHPRLGRPWLHGPGRELGSDDPAQPLVEHRLPRAEPPAGSNQR